MPFMPASESVCCRGLSVFREAKVLEPEKPPQMGDCIMVPATVGTVVLPTGQLPQFPQHSGDPYFLAAHPLGQHGVATCHPQPSHTKGQAGNDSLLVMDSRTNHRNRFGHACSSPSATATIWAS